MSDEFSTDEEDATLDPNIREELRKSRKRAKELEEAQADLDALKRDLAFTKAGIPEDGVGKLLRKAYDGDIDPEAIKAAASEYGITGESSESTETTTEVEQELERARNIAGATGTSNSGPDSQQKILAAWDEAGSVNELMEVIRKQGPEVGVFAPGAGQ